MIYPEVIRADRFHCRNPLLAKDLRLQPQLAAATSTAAALETKLNNNDHTHLVQLTFLYSFYGLHACHF